jgi:spermidine synthase
MAPRSNPSLPLAPLLLLAAVFAFFFVSGACGLAYQVVWTRKLVLLFGTAAYAVSAVLSVFFLGLGLGSAWGGRLADRTPRHLELYALFEVAIGLWALAFLAAVGMGESVVVSLLRLVEGSRGLGIALRVTMTLALLFPPAFHMGATLPLLAKFVNREQIVLGRRVGTLYAFNTFGAVAGCYLAGFHLVPALGYSGATYAAAVANVAVGLLALGVAVRWQRRPEAQVTPPLPASTLLPPALEMPPALVHAVVAGFAVLGFSMLALEVVWTRLLIIVFLGTTYAYAAMLATLLLGIALGSMAAAWAVDRAQRHTALLGGVLMLLGAACIFTLGWIAELPALRAGGTQWDTQVNESFRLAFRVLFLPTFLSGMAFPLAIKAVGGERAALGRHVGRLYAANTIGGVFGALAGGFLLLPYAGAHDSVLLLACLLIAAGFTVMRRDPLTPPRLRLFFTVFIFVPMLYFAWRAAPDDVAQALNASYIPKDHEVIHFAEGVEGTVAVSQPRGDGSGSGRVLWINRVQATVSIEKGVKMNRLQGALPLLFDRDPKSVLFMCFGSGITAGTLALNDFDVIDAVEISPEVLEAAPFFETDNLGVIQNDALVFHIDDGRNYLLRTPKTYDVITFEPMPLALAGVSTFYTQEYYQHCLARLNPGGIVSQWVPLHSLTPELVRALVRTFISVFPESTLWFVNADLFLIGSNQPLQIDFAAAQQRLGKPALRDALEEAGLCGPIDVVACFLMDKTHTSQFAGEGPVMTDNRPWAEFEAPKTIYADSIPASLEAIIPLAQPATVLLAPGSATDEERAALEQRFAARKQGLRALQRYHGGMTVDLSVAEAFLDALALDPGDCNAKYYLRQLIETQVPQFIRWGEHAQAEQLLDRADPHLPGHPLIDTLREELRKPQ